MKPILEIRNISKSFQINRTNERYLSLRDNLWKRIGQIMLPQEKEIFWALKDVSFDVCAGDTIGIIGKNGAGKSTLLKILSRITSPTKGYIRAKGRIASLLEVGTGFHHELSGRENIYLNGSILGLKRSEIKAKFDAIVEFSGVEQFLDTPLKHYSSGMQLRLAFSVATFLEAEVVMVDEVLSVGDAAFQRKCLTKMEEISKQSGRTVLFVSHNLNAINMLCEKTILIKNGQIDKIGKSSNIIDTYIKEEYRNNLTAKIFNDKNNKALIREVRILNSKNEQSNLFTLKEDIIVFLKIENRFRNNIFSIGFALNASSKGRIMISRKSITVTKKKELSVYIHIPKEEFTPGLYSIDLAVETSNVELADVKKNVLNFEISKSKTLYEDINFDYGVLHKDLLWKFD